MIAALAVGALAAPMTPTDDVLRAVDRLVTDRLPAASACVAAHGNRPPRVRLAFTLDAGSTAPSLRADPLPEFAPAPELGACIVRAFGGAGLSVPPPTDSAVGVVLSPDRGGFVAGTAAPLAVDGTLSREGIDHAVRAGLASIRTCHERSLPPNGAGGKVLLAFVIAPDGSAREVRLAQNDLSEQAGACIAEAFRAIRFPPPEGGGLVEVSYPLVFQPG